MLETVSDWDCVDIHQSFIAVRTDANRAAYVQIDPVDGSRRTLQVFAVFIRRGMISLCGTLRGSRRSPEANAGTPIICERRSGDAPCDHDGTTWSASRRLPYSTRLKRPPNKTRGTRMGCLVCSPYHLDA